MRQSRSGGRARAAASLLTLTALLAPAAPAVELQGRTWFASPPWTVEFRNDNPYVMQAGGEYAFTVRLPQQAGVGLGGLLIQQTRGVDRHFPIAAERTRAYLGQPRREGPALAVETRFDNEARLYSVRFPDPPQPGQTVTVVLRPWLNPGQADTYLFAVQALPAGPNPVPASLGFARMAIYNSLAF